MESPITALDLFAGTGWGVACQRLGIHEKGVEIMPEAVATRAANGMETVYLDVWDGLSLTREQHVAEHGPYDLLIASPPCQTFSTAGHGAGSMALNEVLQAIETRAFKDAAALRGFGEQHDPRTALVLSPLAFIYRDRPQYIALEQVLTVLPVWEAYVPLLEGWGYSVKAGVVSAEQHGVPQARRRAVLLARLDGQVSFPAPTHSRFYRADPGRLDEGVLPWLSMADALGWGATDQPSHTITGGGPHGPDPWASGGHTVRARLNAKIGGPNWIPNPEIDTNPDYIRPAGNHRFAIKDVSALQTYPSDFAWKGSRIHQFKQIGNAVPPLLAERILGALLTQGESNV